MEPKPIHRSTTENKISPKYFYRIVGVLKHATVEPYLFFFMFGYFVRLVSYQNLLMERACQVLLNYSDEICTNLSYYKKEQSDSVAAGSNLYIATMVIATLPAFFASMFLGPWSDIYGRKYTLILSTSGVLLSSVFTTMITFFNHANPYLYLAAEIPSGLGGGLLVCLSSSYSYLSDITNERTRPTRYAILEFFFIIAMPVGTLLGGQAFVWGKYLAVMCTCSCGFIISLLLAIFFIKEHKARKEGNKKEMFTDLFQFDNVKSSFKTCTEKRPGNLRLQIWLLVLVSCVAKFISMGNVGVGYPYSKTVFNWGVEQHSNTVTVFYTLDALSTVVIVPLISRKFLLHEAALGLIGTFSLMAKMVLLSVSFREWIFYYAWISGIFSPCSGIAIRSRMSKLVSKQELGRVFSLVATCESLTPVFGGTVMNKLYTSTMDTYPGFVFAFCSALLVPSAIIFCWMTTLPTVSFSQYKETEESRGMRELKDVSTFT